MSAKMKSIVICTVVRTAQLARAVTNSKPFGHEHGSEKPSKTLEFGIGWNKYDY